MKSGTFVKGIMVAAIGLFLAAPAKAATIITVANGAISLNSTDTTNVGSEADPWLVDENMTGAGTLLFSDPTGAAALGTNTTGTGHTFGKWLSKTVFNASAEAWTSFELELQVELGVPSLDGDGLSFAQDGGLVFSSNRFGSYSAIEDIRDYLNFSGGVVNPGESVTFNIAITDNTQRSAFYLLQTPNKREVNPVPEPASLVLLGTGLIGAASRKLRKTK